MLQIIPSHHENVIVVKATGKLTNQDYEHFVPEVEKIIEKKGPVSVLIEFENFLGWDAEALWADFKFGLRHEDDFKKLAIVGEKAWHHLFAVVVKAFTSADVRYFDHDEIQKAWDWLLNVEQGRDGEDEKQDSETDDGPEIDTTVVPYRRIVVATDFSPHAKKALNRAVEIAALYTAEIKVIHVYESMVMFDVYPDDFSGVPVSSPLYDPELDQQLFESSQKRLKELVKDLDFPAITTEVVWGTPAKTILSYAESQNADLIIAGSHGRKGLARLLGSTANGIIHSARCDVLLVRLD